jgi:restriction system protein
MSMGALWFDAEVLADTLSETVGYKAGLTMSVEQMCDHLAGTGYDDTLRASEERVVRIRAEEYDELFYKLLHRIGYTQDEFSGDITAAFLYHKYKDIAPEIHYGVIDLFIEIWPKLIDDAKKNGTKLIDPRSFMQAAYDKYGKLGLDMAIERLEALDRTMNLSPHTGMRYTEWSNVEELTNLFQGSTRTPAFGEFFDQRFIDYLSNNPDAIGRMHWRKFEEMTAEYFVREGFKVELGPGGNDDGVDIRIWKPISDGSTPHGIIQCKRQKDKIERVVVKGLLADVQFEKADLGLIVTSSELSPGARRTIMVRGYPIEEVNKDGIAAWLQQLRTPGTGIVRK